MVKKLLNKIKKAGNLCAAIVAGRMYTPYVWEAIKRYEEAQARQQAEEMSNAALNASLESMAQAMKQSAVSWQDLADAMGELVRQVERAEEERIKRQNTNNWRKMHGLPMRRKAGRKK